MIYAIIVSHNGRSYIESCLDSIKMQDIAINVIVVDNASQDDTVTLVEYNYPDVQLIKLAKNLGFGRANNIGIKIAIDQGADYLLLINQDAWLEKDCINKMLRVISQFDNFLLWSPLHLNSEKSDLDLHFSEFLLQAEPRGKLASDALLGHLNPLYSIPHVNAAVWLMSSEAIAKVGYFNPIFKHYGEDMEYCSRMRACGYSIGIIPSALAVHNRQQKLFNDPIVSKDRFVLKSRARILVSLKNHQCSFWTNCWSTLKIIIGLKFNGSIWFKNICLKIGFLVFAFCQLIRLSNQKANKNDAKAQAISVIQDYKKYTVDETR